MVDFLGHTAARQAASHLAAAGLQTSTLFSQAQATPFQCGHNCAGWATLLHALGPNFHTMTHDHAASINNAAYAAAQNVVLNYEPTARPWLNGDEILKLINHHNPDGANTEANWISGPCPLNYFYTFFAQTRYDQHSHGRIKIMVVNTEPGSGTGFHWFVVAWAFSAQDSENDAE